ncbi:MAG: universal stress protein [Actinomycetota bacterium]
MSDLSDRTAETTQPVRHIAICLDQSPVADRAMPQAMAMARAFGAQLTMLHVLEPSHDVGRPSVADPLDWELRRAEAKQYLRGMESMWRGRSTGDESLPEPTRSEVLEGRPAEAILSWVATNGVDLTVLTSHGERGQTGWPLAGTARKLVDGLPTSVLLVPARAEPEPTERATRYERVLVPLDGSARAESALAIAGQVARLHGAQLTLLHVVASPPHPCPHPFDEREKELDRLLVERNLRAATAYLDTIVRRTERDGIRVRPLVIDRRDTRNAIQHRIEIDGIDLVVMSGHGHGGRAEQAVGTVAGYLVEQATVPLLLVRDGPPTATTPDRQTRADLRLPHASGS